MPANSPTGRVHSGWLGEVIGQLGVGMQRVQVQAVAGRAGPLDCRFHGSAFPPFAEGGHQLPLDAGGGHITHILVPAVDVAGEPLGIAFQPKTRADGDNSYFPVDRLPQPGSTGARYRAGWRSWHSQGRL